MSSLAGLVLKHRRVVIAFWLVMLAVGAMSAGTATDRLTFDFSLPGQPGYETEQQILRIYGNGASNPPYIPVVTVPMGETVDQHAEEIAGIFTALQRALPQDRVVDYAATGDERFVTDDGRTTYALVYAPQPLDFADRPDVAIQSVLEEQTAGTGLDVKLTGYNILAAGEGA